ATACDIDRGKIAHAGEAVGVHDRRPTDGGVGDPRLWYLEQDAAQRVVDLLVVLVLAFGQALEHRAEADLLQKVGVPEGGVQRDGEGDIGGGPLNDDLLRRERGELLVGVSAGGHGRVELAVDHAVRAIPDHRELVRESGIHARLIAPVRLELDAEGRKELRISAVLDLRPDDPARDLEALFYGEVRRKRGDDAVVLASEERMQRGERDVLVRSDVAGDHRTARH